MAPKHPANDTPGRRAPAPFSASALRLSAPARLAIVLAPIALLWGAVFLTLVWWR